MHPSGASGANFEVFPRPAQFQVRAPPAILHFRQDGFRIRADCSTDEHWADCGLHFGHLANRGGARPV
eukprot:3889077-Alexandrium_andersonii.AAC.1